MAASSDVAAGNQATAAQYNNLRADVLDNLLYTELFTVAHNPVGINAWEDWDVSALVPAGVTDIEVAIKCPTAALGAGVRNNGSALDRRLTPAQGVSFTMWSPVDASRVCEIYGKALTDIFQIIGYLARWV